MTHSVTESVFRFAPPKLENNFSVLMFCVTLKDKETTQNIYHFLCLHQQVETIGTVFMSLHAYASVMLVSAVSVACL